MEYEIELKKIDNLRKLIKKTTNKNEKICLISDYINIIAYLNDIGVISGELYLNDMEQYLKLYDKHIQREKILYCNDYIDNMDKIIYITDELMKIYNKYPLLIDELSFKSPINMQVGIDSLYEFFNMLGEDFYKVFYKMMSENRISTRKGLYDEGKTYNANHTDFSYILLNDRDNEYDTLSSLAHEIGHCYEFFISDKKRIYPLYNLAELSSLFIQRLYDSYIIINHQYKEYAKYCQMMWQYVLLNRTLSNDFNNKAYLDERVEGLDYDYGIFTYNGDLSGYMNDKNQKAVVEYMPSLDNYLYVICDLIACNFVEMYYQDPKETLKLLKKILKEPLSFDECLRKYGMSFKESERLIKEASLYSRKILIKK